MVNRGWASADLDDMDESAFLTMFEEQMAMDEARAEAERAAAEAAARK